MATANFTTLSPWLSTMNNHVQTEEKFKQEPQRPKQKLRRHYRLTAQNDHLTETRCLGWNKLKVVTLSVRKALAGD